MAKAKVRIDEYEYESSGGDYYVPLDVVPAGSGGGPRGFVTWVFVSPPPNPFIQAPTPKLQAELKAKKRVPAKSGPPQLIFDETAANVLVPKRSFRWADEIAHEIAEAEKAWDEAYRDAHGEHLERHPELMVAACELMLETKDFGADIDLLADHFLPGFLHRSQWMLGLMQFFALDCLVPVDAKEMRQELMQQPLTSLLRLAKAVNWGQPIESKDWTG